MSKIRYDNLFEKIIDPENIDWAYKKSMKGKNRFSHDAIMFSLNETQNLEDLRKHLVDGTYQFKGYKRFMVYEPKERIIDAPYHIDKIVQLSIDRVLKRVYQPCFIYDSYACLDDKGTHKAVFRVSDFMRRAAANYGEDAFIVKLDVRRFFYTVDRDILKRLLRKKIKCRRTLDIVDHIIDSAALIDDKGLPLGNTLSQLLTNVYMNEFDQYCKRKLRIKYYVRYADDVIAIVENKAIAMAAMDDMGKFLKSALNLDVHTGKTRVFPIEQGVNAYGFKIYKTHRLLRNDSKKKIKRKTKKMPRLMRIGRMTPEKSEQILNSWYGHARYGCSRNFINQLMQHNDFIYQDYTGALRVDVQKVREGAK